MNPTAVRLLQLVLISLFLLSINTVAQTPTPTPQSSPMTSQQSQPTPTPSTPAANPADVGSMDAIIAAVYDVISGPAGKKRDWDRMRSLFIPGARLIPTGPRPGGVYGSRVLTVEDYVTRGTTLFEKEGFYEKEIARKTRPSHLFAASTAFS